MRTLTLLFALSLVSNTVQGGSNTPSDNELNKEKLTRAQSAAHPEISRDATVIDVDGTLLKEGSNDWTCMPGTKPGDNHPMCNDPVWAQMMKAAASGATFQTERLGISYMLQGDSHVSNDNPAATDPNNGDVWVREGPHLMIVAPRETLQGIPDDPYNGGPYVMWRNTPYAHIMVPIRSTE